MFSCARIIVSIIGIVFLAGCAASGPTISTPIRQGPAASAPVYRSGDQWTYRVVRQTGKNEQVVISYRDGKFETDNPEIFDGSSWAIVHRADSELKPLNFPLASGKSWSYRYQATDARGVRSSRNAEVKVIGPTAQPVTTAAGQFKAIEMQRSEWWGRGAERKTTYFYSEDTRSVVKLTGNLSSPVSGSLQFEMELLKYSAGK